VKSYLQHKKKFIKPVISVNAYAGKSIHVKTNSPHPELYKLLRKKRDALCEEKNMAVYLIAGSNTLEEMAMYLPQTFSDLNRISGFGPVKTGQFGETFLNIIREYCEQNDLNTNIEEKPAKIKRIQKNTDIKTETKTSSYTLYKEGKTIEEIASERNMAVGTIEGHLSYFISIGEIDINTIIAPEKQVLIKFAIEKFGHLSQKTLKENLPESISYGEIRMVLASLTKTKS